MKLSLLILVLALAGCASQPMTFQQRLAIANYLQNSRYVLPTPQQMYIPQTNHYLCNVSGNYVSCTGN